MRPALFSIGLAAVALACTPSDGMVDTSSSFGGPGDGDPGDGDGDSGETGTSDTTTTDTGPASCGDGVVDADEECDLGPANSESGQCTPECQIAECGDGYLFEGFEECDDGNFDNTDDCVDSCLFATCGDGFVQSGVEACDDGNDDDADGCTTSCVPAVCGDGVVQEGEQCDDANDDGTDACLPDCQLAYCGDGYVFAGEEQCDGAGETADCDVDCTVPECGDMTVNMSAGEECDDANEDNYDDCTDACLLPACGDGYRQLDEECDDQDFGEASCDDYGFNSGDLMCTVDCVIDSSECFQGECPEGGAFVNNYCWYASEVCESTAQKCQSVGLTGSDGYVQTTWDMAVMDAVADQLGLMSGGDAGCCVEFGWIENGTIYTHNFGDQFYNWGNCYSNKPTLKACNAP